MTTFLIIIYLYFYEHNSAVVISGEAEFKYIVADYGGALALINTVVYVSNRTKLFFGYNHAIDVLYQFCYE